MWSLPASLFLGGCDSAMAASSRPRLTLAPSQRLSSTSAVSSLSPLNVSGWTHFNTRSPGDALQPHPNSTQDTKNRTETSEWKIHKLRWAQRLGSAEWARRQIGEQRETDCTKPTVPPAPLELDRSVNCHQSSKRGEPEEGPEEITTQNLDLVKGISLQSQIVKKTPNRINQNKSTRYSQTPEKLRQRKNFGSSTKEMASCLLGKSNSNNKISC